MGKNTDFHYTVVGSYPFLLDMLRYDGAKALTPQDQRVIDRLSKNHAPDWDSMVEKVEIALVIKDAGRREPKVERWRSFGWTVKDMPTIHTDEKDRLERLEKLRDSALSKLTDEERQALEWFAGRSFTGEPTC